MPQALIWINAQWQISGHMMLMAPRIDIVELARDVAEIARTTTDPDTAMKLIRLVDRLLSEAGLPTGDEAEGGGEPPPNDWRHAAPVDCPECA